MEESVYNTFKPLAVAEHSLVMTPSKGAGIDSGVADVVSFDGLDIVRPSGMTTGDVFMLRRQDVRITEHRKLEIEPVDTDADTKKTVVRVGADITVVNPGFQGKMTDKD